MRTLSATASLAVASVKNDTNASKSDIRAVVASVQESVPARIDALDSHRRSHILWVDDHPDNNINERQAFEAMGLSFQLAYSTNEALQAVANQPFAAIISDMGRKEGPREGYVLLDALRKNGNGMPFFIYASSNAPEHKKETAEHDGQGCTNSPQELFRMVMRALIDR